MAPRTRQSGQSGPTTNRRGYLRSFATTLCGGGLASTLAERDLVRPVAAEERSFDDGGGTRSLDAEPDVVFPQSVMSGGPTPTGALVWTRIAPECYEETRPLGVAVAETAAFDSLVYQGTVAADAVSPGHDYTVTVDLDDHLDADRHYWYRFVYGGVTSKTGRLRTLPAPDQQVETLSLAVLSCQDYQNGYYPAYHHLAREDVDFVLHLGDFIYESANGAYTSPLTGIKPGRAFDLPSGASLAETLDDFRYLYQTYKADSFLQETLERHTLIAGWDDHEIGNNRFWDAEANAPVLPAKDGGADPAFAIEVTANGIQAWVEHMPMRVEYDSSASDLHEQFSLWREFVFGDLVDLVLTDERLYRDGPPCDDRRLTCRDEENPNRTMLGSEQKRRFKRYLDGSEARWTVWANEVLTMPLTAGDGWNQVELFHDSWDGFQAERAELMAAVQNADLRNFVTFTGDLHCAMAGYQRAGYGEVSWDFERVGVELVTPAVSSINAADALDFPGDWDGGRLAAAAKRDNEHIQYVDWYVHGYAIVEFSPEECVYSVYGVDKDRNDPDATRRLAARYRVPDGEVRLNDVTPA